MTKNAPGKRRGGKQCTQAPKSEQTAQRPKVYLLLLAIVELGRLNLAPYLCSAVFSLLPHSLTAALTACQAVLCNNTCALRNQYVVTTPCIMHAQSTAFTCDCKKISDNISEC